MEEVFLKINRLSVNRVCLRNGFNLFNRSGQKVFFDVVWMKRVKRDCVYMIKKVWKRGLF